MIFFVALLSAILTTFVWFGKNSIDENSSIFKKTILRVSFEFLVPFTIISIVYSLLQIWLITTSSYLDTSLTIWQLEDRLLLIQSKLISPLKLSSTTKLLIVVAILCLGCLKASWEAKLLKTFRITSKTLTRLFVLTTILVSFTFFSSHLGDEVIAGTLRIKHQIELTRQSYSEYYQRIYESVEEKLIEEICTSNPIFDLLDKFDQIRIVALEGKVYKSKLLSEKELDIETRLDRFDRQRLEAESKAQKALDRLRDHKRQVRLKIGPGAARSGQYPGAWSLDEGRKLRVALEEATSAKSSSTVQGQSFGAKFRSALPEFIDASLKRIGRPIITEVLSDIGLNTELGLVKVFRGQIIFKELTEIVKGTTQEFFDRTTKDPNLINSLYAQLRAKIRTQIHDPLRKVSKQITEVSRAVEQNLATVRQYRDKINADIEQKANELVRSQLRSFWEAWAKRFFFGNNELNMTSLGIRQSLESWVRSSYPTSVNRFVAVRYIQYKYLDPRYVNMGARAEALIELESTYLESKHFAANVLHQTKEILESNNSLRLDEVYIERLNNWRLPQHYRNLTSEDWQHVSRGWADRRVKIAADYVLRGSRPTAGEWRSELQIHVNNSSLLLDCLKLENALKEWLNRHPIQISFRDLISRYLEEIKPISNLGVRRKALNIASTTVSDGRIYRLFEFCNRYELKGTLTHLMQFFQTELNNEIVSQSPKLRPDPWSPEPPIRGNPKPSPKPSLLEVILKAIKRGGRR